VSGEENIQHVGEISCGALKDTRLVSFSVRFLSLVQRNGCLIYLNYVVGEKENRPTRRNSQSNMAIQSDSSYLIPEENMYNIIYTLARISDI
jgi:hypothetical protein